MKTFIVITLFLFQLNLFSQDDIAGKWEFIGYYNFDKDTFYNRIQSSSYYYRNFEIEFFSDNQTFKGITSQNRIYGSYSIVEDKIKVTRIGGTRAGYGLDMIVYTRALRNVNKYTIKNDTLSLYTTVLKQDLLHIKSNRQLKDSVKIRIDLVTKAVIEKEE